MEDKNLESKELKKIKEFFKLQDDQEEITLEQVINIKKNIPKCIFIQFHLVY